MKKVLSWVSALVVACAVTLIPSSAFAYTVNITVKDTQKISSKKINTLSTVCNKFNSIIAKLEKIAKTLEAKDKTLT